MKKWITLCMVGLVSVSLLSGCGSQSSSSNQKDDAQADQATKQEVYDNYGSKVAIDYEPEHVITMGPNATELFCALGINQKVIGDCLNNHSRGALPKYKEKYENIPELTHAEPTREAVLGTNVDFIYGIDWAFGSEGIEKKDLDDAKIPTYINKAQTFNQEYNEIRDLGKIFHVEKKANEIIHNQQTRIKKVEDAVKDDKKTRVLVYDSGNNGIFTATGHNFENELINAAGGQNIFDDVKNKEWTTVSAEEAAARNPEVIIIHDYDKPSVKQKIKDIEKDPALAKTDAVKHHRFISIPLEAVLPGIRMANTVEKFGHAFHPNQVSLTKQEEDQA